MAVDTEFLSDPDALAARAHELHGGCGHNCAQAVACALAPAVGVDHDLCFRMLEGFGAGMGGMTETCGALSGAVAVLGLARSGGIENPVTKGATYRLDRDLLARFREQNGSTVCGELKGRGTGTVLRSCEGCVEDATRMAADILRGLDA